MPRNDTAVAPWREASSRRERKTLVGGSIRWLEGGCVCEFLLVYRRLRVYSMNAWARLRNKQGPHLMAVWVALVIESSGPRGTWGGCGSVCWWWLVCGQATGGASIPATHPPPTHKPAVCRSPPAAATGCWARWCRSPGTAERPPRPPPRRPPPLPPAAAGPRRRPAAGPSGCRRRRGRCRGGAPAGTRRRPPVVGCGFSFGRLAVRSCWMGAYFMPTSRHPMPSPKPQPHLHKQPLEAARGPAPPLAPDRPHRALGRQQARVRPAQLLLAGAAAAAAAPAAKAGSRRRAAREGLAVGAAAAGGWGGGAEALGLVVWRYGLGDTMLVSCLQSSREDQSKRRVNAQAPA
jgi:hypothetical protein